MLWTFDRPTQREDGADLPIAEISHYVATIDGEYEYELPASATSIDLSLPDGIHCCSIVCIDTDGQPSIVSNEVCQEQNTAKAPPNPPVVYEPDEPTPPETGMRCADREGDQFCQDFEGYR
jgi:hypothetical protein